MRTRETFNQELGRRIQDRRRALGLSQKALAEACGKQGNSWVARLEAGQLQPSLWDLAQMAQALEVGVDDFLRTDTPSPAAGGAEDRGLGGPALRTLPKLREARLLPLGALLTVWPGAVANPQALPFERAVCIARLGSSRPVAGAAWLVPSLGGLYRFVPMPGHWRQRRALADLDEGHEVLMVLRDQGV